MNYFDKRKVWMNDLKNSNICLFKLFEFSCFAHVEITTDLLVWSNPNQSKRRLRVQ